MLKTKKIYLVIEKKYKDSEAILLLGKDI